jgi:hypothetical protein
VKLSREAGWTLEEVVYYLGYVTVKGTLAIQAAVHHIWVSREWVKEKLKGIRG